MFMVANETVDEGQWEKGLTRGGGGTAAVLHITPNTLLPPYTKMAGAFRFKLLLQV